MNTINQFKMYKIKSAGSIKRLNTIQGSAYSQKTKRMLSS